MLWACLAAGGAGALQKAGGVIKTEAYVHLLKQCLNTSATKLKKREFSRQRAILKLWQNG